MVPGGVDGAVVTTTRHVASHVRPPRRPPPSPSALLVAGAGVSAVAVVAVCAASASAWPAAVLPVLAVALAGVRSTTGAAAASTGILLVAAVAAVVVRPSAPAALGLGLAVVAAAGAVVAWRVQRVRIERALDGERERAAATSVVDDLTGCFNTHGVELLGEHVLQLVRRQSGAMHGAVVEVEGLAPVLDALGPSAVEEVLIAVSEALRGATRGSDVVGRSGELTFVVVGPGTGMGALDLERRLRGTLLQAPPLSLREWPCTVVVGVGQLQPWDSGGVPDLVARAEEDLGLRRALRAPAVDPQTSTAVADPGA